MSAIFIYVTASSEAEAEKIAEAVITDRLAACANIIPGIKSIYHWQGNLQKGSEVAIIFKTLAELFPAVEARVKEIHPHKTPCIAALPLSAVADSYMRWILSETMP